MRNVFANFKSSSIEVDWGIIHKLEWGLVHDNRVVFVNLFPLSFGHFHRVVNSFRVHTADVIKSVRFFTVHQVAHCSIKFEVSVSLSHSRFVEINNVEFLKRDLPVWPSKNNNFGIVWFCAKLRPCKSSKTWCCRDYNRFPNISFRLVSFDHCLSKHWMMRVFTLATTTYTPIDVYKIREPDHSKIRACTFHWRALDPVRCDSCCFSFCICLNLTWSKVRRKIENFNGA